MTRGAVNGQDTALHLSSSTVGWSLRTSLAAMIHWWHQHSAVFLQLTVTETKTAK